MRKPVACLIGPAFVLLLSAGHLSAQENTLSCWYDAAGSYTGADSYEGTVGTIDRTGSGEYAGGYMISAFDGTACPRMLPGTAVRGTTTYLVRQDFSDCGNSDVRATPSNVGGTATIFRLQDGSAEVAVRLDLASPSTTYQFFHKCVAQIGSVTTDGRGNGSASMSIAPGADGTPVTFDMYPAGAPAGNKYQSVPTTF